MKARIAVLRRRRHRPRGGAPGRRGAPRRGGAGRPPVRADRGAGGRRRHRRHRRSRSRRPRWRSAAPSDAILFGAIGGPKLGPVGAGAARSRGCWRCARELGLFANLRPVTVNPRLAAASPLKAELLVGVDLLVVRELTGGIYFGEKTADRRPAPPTSAPTRWPRSSGWCGVAGALARGRRRQAHLGRQGQRAGDLAAVARGGRAGGHGRVPRRASSSTSWSTAAPCS